MSNLSYKTVTSTVTLKPGFDNGKVAVEIWKDNEVITKFLVDYLWDFLADLYLSNPPKNIPGIGKQESNYLDRGRRYYQMVKAAQQVDEPVQDKELKT